MLNVGHLDLNSVQFCSDSLKERLKPTMLNQELIYMGQVVELHRLYRIQIAMAEDNKQRGLDSYNSHARGVNSSSVNLNSQVHYSMRDIQCSSSGFTQKPFDLNLTADEFICQSAKKNPVSFDLNISLSIGEETSKDDEEHRSWMGKRTIAPPPEIIDLEDPNSKFSNKDENLTLPSPFAAPISSFKENNIDKRNIESFSRNGTMHVSEGTTSSKPFINVDQANQGKTLCNSGVNGEFIASDKSASRRVVMFDLNTIQIEDLSNTQPEVAVPLPTAFSTVKPTSGREINLNNCAEINDVNVQNNLFFEDKSSRGTKSKDKGKGKIIFIDLDPDSESDEELRSGPDPKIEILGSSSKLLPGLTCGLEMGEAVGPESVIQKVLPEPICQKSLVIDEHPSDQKLSNSCQSDILNVKTMQPGINGATCQMIDMGLHSRAAQQRSSESPDSKRLCFKGKEVDEAMQEVADLLAEFSVICSSQVSRIKEHDGGPQRSLDSYEAMVLNAKECGPDDYCESSHAFDVDVSKMKDSRYKLKRGTRMKNFQKDILSSLSSLSGEEIEEDKIIFDGVLNSREYKRMKGKMAVESEQRIPTRSKRSRISRR